VEFLLEFRFVSEVSVWYTQHGNLVCGSLEVRSDILAVEYFHDDDNIRPIDDLLGQWGTARLGHYAGGLGFPYPFPALKDLLCGWATLQIRRTNEQYFPHIPTRGAIRVEELD